MEKRIKIYDKKFISACYFRSTVEAPNKKVIIQITERCNLFCKHCFVSSSRKGDEISFDKFRNNILSKLLQCNTVKITLTGGEPLVHPNIKEIIELLSNNGIEVAVCTNAVLISDELIQLCSHLGTIHFNVSLDGFRPESHGTFRGNSNPDLFKTIINNISKLGQAHLLNGILVTPNKYANIEEYQEICKFAKSICAKYVLFNPLSEFGRGQDATEVGRYKQQLVEIKELTQDYSDENFEVVYIRFPDPTKPIGDCPIGKILYVFTNGDVAICPYVAFAAKDRKSIYNSEQFIVTNIFELQGKLDDELKKYRLPFEPINKKQDILCKLKCSKGCYVAKISHGLSIYDCDYDLCGLKNL